MAWCQPATQCGCGCSIEFGVRAILIFYLFRNLSFIYRAFMAMVFRSEGFSDPVGGGGMSLQAFLAAWALAGLPLICGSLWAIGRRCEVPLRMFGYYLSLSFLIDMAFVARDILPAMACSHLPALLPRNGAAFACGAARGLTAATVLAIVLTEAYLIFIVFSYCEHLAMSADSDLSDLTVTGPLMSAARRTGPYSGDYGGAYAAFSTSSADPGAAPVGGDGGLLGGPSVPLFAGRYAKTL
jgi:hypothetical protein